MQNQSCEEVFNKIVGLKYQLYNSLFLTLPFPSLEELGIKLPIFTESCRAGLEKGLAPCEILDGFFQDIIGSKDFEQRMRVLFLFVQLIERQVVLFDALEEAAFSQTRAREQENSLSNLIHRSAERSSYEEFARILEVYRTRVVLTAHPTQFYPEAVLGIIKELASALKEDDLILVEQLLLQLGKTSFRNLQAPTPLSEARDLMDRVRNTFYEAILDIEAQMDELLEHRSLETPCIELGFWPGGDRDGNPHVTAETTLTVANELRECALSHYREEIGLLRRRLTFPGMAAELDAIEKRLEQYMDPSELLADIDQLCKLIQSEHQGLFIEHARRFRLAVKTFGFHFASLDLRQDSGVHEDVVSAVLSSIGSQMNWPSTVSQYASLSGPEKTQLLTEILSGKLPEADQLSLKDVPVSEDVFRSLGAIKKVQAKNGTKGLHRYIVSNTQGAHHILELILLMGMTDCDARTMDLVPLFETVEDLKKSIEAMKVLYECDIYKKHLRQRENCQTVMVGFSDGTKDGGYLTCNWEIFRAKQQLEALSAEYGIHIVFFDGRGGPPARGGGNTHKFYRALGSSLQQREVQLTIQGQTISSNFGNRTTARFNMEQLFTSGLEAQVSPLKNEVLSDGDIELLSQLSDRSYETYMGLRKNPSFLPFLEELTPLNHFGSLNVASRPGRRHREEKLSLKDLRAIPFVSAWSQTKLNVPGFFGLGTALEWAFREGRGEEVRRLYHDKLFFRTLLDNAMQAIAKSNESFTRFLLKDENYGPIVQLLHSELHLTRKMVLEVSGQRDVLEVDPINRRSIQLRELLILPLVTIQQYTLSELRSQPDGEEKTSLEKLLLKTLPPIINASRNSA